MTCSFLRLAKTVVLPCLIVIQQLTCLAYYSLYSPSSEEQHIRYNKVRFPYTGGQLVHQDTKSQLSAGNNNISVAIGIALTTRTKEMTPTDIRNHTFFTELMPSFCLTASTGYSYHFYVGFDYNDPLLSKPDQLEMFNDTFVGVKNGICRRLTFLGLNLIKCAHSGKPAWAQNDAMMSAYMDHNDYFYRINDDTTIVTKRWTKIFINTLLGYNPPNIGVVGPAHFGDNNKILTYDFVHRSHIDIFGFYYPREFSGWHADEWITNVYKPGRVAKISQMVLMHTRSGGTRYVIHRLARVHIKTVVDKGKVVLKRHIGSIESSSLAGHKNRKHLDKGKVIGLSLVGNNPAELYGAIRNVLLQRIHFPDWNVRIYLELPSNSTVSLIPINIANKLKQLPVQLVHVDTQKLKLDSSLWPVLAVDDPSVDYLLVRKASSRLSDRDAAVVHEWLASKKVLHVIKDHPTHSVRRIVPGLWGIDTKKFKSIVAGGILSLLYKTQTESSFLNDILWSLVSNDTLCHDSISSSNETQPFPVMKLHHEYLGQEFRPLGEFTVDKFENNEGSVAH